MFSAESSRLKNMVKALIIALFAVFLFSFAGNHHSHASATNKDLASEISSSQPAFITRSQTVNFSPDFVPTSGHTDLQLPHLSSGTLAEAIALHHWFTDWQREMLNIKPLVSRTLFRHFHSMDAGEQPPLG